MIEIFTFILWMMLECKTKVYKTTNKNVNKPKRAARIMKITKHSAAMEHSFLTRESSHTRQAPFEMQNLL